MIQPTANHGTPVLDVGWCAADPSGAGSTNPYLPGNIYALKWEGMGERSTIVMEFDSWRMPVWGDFYAKDGELSGVYASAYNTTFLNPDPIAPPQQESLGGKILRPDTLVPEPGTILLLGLGPAGAGLCGFGRKRRAGK